MQPPMVSDLTVLDWLACQILAAMLSSRTPSGNPADRDKWVREAYDFAEAMLKERDRRLGQESKDNQAASAARRQEQEGKRE